MNRTLDEWIEAFNKRAARKFERDRRFALFYLPDKGFCEMGITDKIVLISCISGDARFWVSKAEELARAGGVKACAVFYGGRKGIRAWARLLGFKIERVEEKGGFKRYHSTKKNGGWGILTETIGEDGRRGGIVTWEVKPNET